MIGNARFVILTGATIENQRQTGNGAGDNLYRIEHRTELHGAITGNAQPSVRRLPVHHTIEELVEVSNRIVEPKDF